MTLSAVDLSWLTDGEVAAACGLGMVMISYLLRGRYRGNWKPDASWAGVAFLAGCLLPIGVVFLIHPFVDKPLDYEKFKAYLPLAGLSILWIAGMTVKQAVDLGTDSKEPATRRPSADEITDRSGSRSAPGPGSPGQSP